MKLIVNFLKLQQDIADGLTEEQIKEKVEYLKSLYERDDLTKEVLRKERKKVITELNSGIKNKKEHESYLNYFAGKITPTSFKYSKTFSKWKSEEKKDTYIRDLHKWISEKDEILKKYNASEILLMFIEKEKEKLLETKKELGTKSMDKDLEQLDALSNMISFSEDLKFFESEPVKELKKENKNRAKLRP